MTHTTHAHQVKNSPKQANLADANQPASFEIGYLAVTPQECPPISGRSVRGDAKPVPKDGDCFFAAVGSQLNPPQTPNGLRNSVVSFFVRNPELQLPCGLTLREATENSSGTSYDRYCHAMAATAYGGYMESVVVKMMFGEAINVVQRDSHDPRLFHTVDGELFNPLARVHIVWSRGITESGNHYDILVQDKDTEPTVPHATATSTDAPSFADVAKGIRRAPKRAQPGHPKTHNTLATAAVSVIATKDEAKAPAGEATAMHVSAPERQYILDTGATVHLVDPTEPLSGVQPATVVVEGISGRLQTTRQAVHPTFGDALIREDAQGRNIVSFNRLRATHSIDYDATRNAFIAKRGSEQLVFLPKNGLYVMAQASSSYSYPSANIAHAINHPLGSPAGVQDALVKLDCDFSRTIDLGCGTGNLIGAILRAQPHSTCEGIDIDQTLLDTARKRVPQATFRCGNVTSIEIPSVFSTVVTNPPWDIDTLQTFLRVAIRALNTANNRASIVLIAPTTFGNTRFIDSHGLFQAQVVHLGRITWVDIATETPLPSPIPVSIFHLKRNPKTARLIPASERLHAVMQLHNSLHHPGDAALARSLSDGTIVNPPCSAEDLYAARRLFGPCAACVAGKATDPPAPPSTRPLPLMGTELHVDIMKFTGTTSSLGFAGFLIAIEPVSAFVLGRELSRESSQVLTRELLALIDSVNTATQRRVTTVRCDPQPGLVACAPELASKQILLVVVPAERHVRLAERAIRDIRDHMRATLCSLPFPLPSRLLPYLIADVISARNVVSHQHSSSPKELLTGKKLDAQLDFRLPFGFIGFTQVSGTANTDRLQPQAELAILVQHCPGESKSVLVWLPRTGSVVKRHGIRPAAITTQLLMQVFDKIDGPIDPTSIASPNASESESTTLPLDAPLVTPPPDAEPALAQSSATPQPPANEYSTTPIETPNSPVAPPSHTPTSDSAALPTQRPQRNIKPPQRLPGENYDFGHARALQADLTNHAGDYALLLSLENPPEGNLRIKDARQIDPDATSRAVVKELKQLIDLGVINRRTSYINVLPSKMFLKYKVIDGAPAFKARLVIGGHRQDPDTMGETYSPTIRHESLNVALAYASHHRASRIRTLDVSGAFLHVPLTGPEVHMRLSPDVVQELLPLNPDFGPDVDAKGCLIVRILKAIYGLGESSRQWNEHLLTTLASAGYRPTQYDPSLLLRHRGGRLISILCIHVDDILAFDFDVNPDDSLVTALNRAYGSITLHDGPELTYLGMSIIRDGPYFRLHQRRLIDAVSYSEPDRPSLCPAPANILGPHDDSPPARDPKAFVSTLMRILYIVGRTRFDLLFATTALTCRQQTCTQQDEAALAQLVKFLKTTRDWDYIIAPKNLDLVTCADASYATHPDAHGHSGFFCFIGGSVVFARSVKQKLIAKSSTEAELLALNDAVDETLYLRNILTELGCAPQGPTPVFQDNKSTITLANRGDLGSKRTKHFTVRHYFVTDQIRRGFISLQHIPGTVIHADGLTKPLPGSHAYDWAREILKGHVIFPPPNDALNQGGVLKDEDHNGEEEEEEEEETAPSSAPTRGQHE